MSDNLELFQQCIKVALQIINEFAERINDCGGPETQLLVRPIKTTTETFANAQEMMFRVLASFIVSQIAIHKDLIQKKDPQFWNKLSFFGMNFKGFWTSPALTPELKDCIWKYMMLFIEVCEKAMTIENLPEHLCMFDAILKDIFPKATQINLPSLFSVFKTFAQSSPAVSSLIPNGTLE